MEQREIDIFDMDRTLIDTPDFVHFIAISDGEPVNTNIHFPDHFKAIKTLFWDILMKEVSFVKDGDRVIVVNSKNKSKIDEMQFYDMMAKNSNVSKYLKIENNAVVVKHPSGFYSDPDTLGYSVNNPIFRKYKNAKNKAVLTGRGEKLRPHILKMFKFLHMPEPNRGLLLWPGKPNIMQWKADTISAIAATGQWDVIHFYEDREDWLSYAKETVEKNHPNIKFVAHHITSVNENTLI